MIDLFNMKMINKKGVFYLDILRMLTSLFDFKSMIITYILFVIKQYDH